MQDLAYLLKNFEFLGKTNIDVTINAGKFIYNFTPTQNRLYYFRASTNMPATAGTQQGIIFYESSTVSFQYANMNYKDSGAGLSTVDFSADYLLLVPNSQVTSFQIEAICESATANNLKISRYEFKF